MLAREALFGPLLDVRFTDLVDVFVVTAFVYTALVLIRRTQAAFVAIGMLILSAVYIVARAFDLQLTVWMLQGFFAIFVIILVVVFQEELRQWFERLAVWGLRRDRTMPLTDGATDILVQCVADFARDRIGALIVLPGRQPIERHLRSGIELNGQLSLPALESLFDPHSPGHDGAVIIEGDRISRFAVHLPLSTDFRQLSGVGTRHSAALGLTELSDALCLVVSEERGGISVARDRRLRQVTSAHALASEIRQFLSEQQPARNNGHLGLGLVRRNWLEKVAALVLVIGLWYLYVPGSRPTQMTFDVPVRVLDLPDGYAMSSIDPATIAVTLSGPTRSFYLFDRQALSVTVDGGLARLGRRTFQISEHNVHHPNDLTVERINPKEVRISLAKGANDTSAGGG